ncbi:glycoside hydrolase family 98 domain-containing protein [Filimonas effusa]|uniref:Carbohydrate-binding protein n=1 Tax=Filimonas effusa TaxID=2508721 RepID=A0A4V1MAD7_9BACT|nr:glycoside hydrolase family 98 domain-containing protein [Filimonas effusa]RXK85516.1 carbohydrate-binding protein [Filimonas effusa]
MKSTLLLKSRHRFAWLIALLLFAPFALHAQSAPLRRPISPSQPMWLIHIDSWNQADPQKIINMVPADIRPYVVFNISISINHDRLTSKWLQAEYGYEIAKSWLRVCAENRVWAMIQQSSGGFQHFSQSDLTVYEEFYRDYPNFIGFSYAEQFWGFDGSLQPPSSSSYDPLSPPWADRINLFANLLQLSNRYGGYLVVSWCPNQWNPNINPIGMLKRNAAFAAACRNYTENYILCEKYTQQTYQHDMESTCMGAYMSGYAGQYGIRYDETGWTDSTGTHANFTPATGVAPHLEHIMLTGQTVIDGTELIMTQQSRELNTAATPDGFTTRRWEFYPQLYNVNLDLFRKILDGHVRIPTRREVIDRTKVIIVNDVSSGSNQDQYSTPQTLFEGLYRMDTDGNYELNKSFFKKTGRYPSIPIAYQLDDTDANSFQVKINKSAYASRWPNITAKVNEMNTLFPSEYTGTLYAGRHENGWVTYNPFKTNQTATASIPFKYNTCSSMELSYAQYSAGVIKEYSNRLNIYLNNYDNVINTGLKTDIIRINGASTQPTWSYTDRGSHQASAVSGSWSGGVFTLTVQHNGPLDITINCAGTATGRLTSYTTATLVTPTQPPIYAGPLQHEAEHFDYRSINGNTANGASGTVRSYTGQGYLRFGTNAAASIRDTVSLQYAGSYQLRTRYSLTGGNVNTIGIYVNGSLVATPVFNQTDSNSAWAVQTQNITLNAGNNVIEFRASGAASNGVYFDNIEIVPISSGGNIIQENTTGFCSVNGTVDSNNGGYTGAGFANTDNAAGNGINWKVNFASTGTKSFTFRYASIDTRAANLLINGTVVAANVSFPSTGSWTNWSTVTVYTSFTSGIRDIRLEATGTSGLPNVDYMEVVGGTAAACTSGLSTVMATSVTSNDDKAQKLTAKTAGIEIFPNPAVHHVTVRLDSRWKAGDQLTLCDATGKRVEIRRIKGNAEQVNVSKLPPGMYFINVFNNSGIHVSLPVIKQ